MRFQQLLQLGFHCLVDQLLRAGSQQLRQQISGSLSTPKLNNVILPHSGVSPQVGSLSGDNKSTRYAAFLQLLKHQIRLYLPLSGGTGVIEPYCDYLKTLYATVSGLYADGLSDFEMKATVVGKLAAYQDWSGFSDEVGKHISLALLEIERAEFE
jgi:hypothetical protein